MSNYQSMASRIRQARTDAQFAKLEKSLINCYNAGVFTVAEFMRLDGLLVDCRIASQ